MKQRVLVFGGTHGNEWTGIMAVSHYAEALKQKYPGLDLEFVLANPEAYRINKRFKDEDLNRAFQFLGEDRKGSYEHERAKELKALIDSAPCFVIDLHTTTSNMGPTIIVSHGNRKNFHVCSKLKAYVPNCRVILSPDPQRKYMASQSDFGLMIEVGPVANGVVDPTVLEETLSVLHGILSVLEKNDNPLPGEIELFEEIQDVFYPVDSSGVINAYIHSSLQGKDFKPLKGRYTPFKTFDGKTIELKTEEELFPIFINEAAYYPTKLAFTLCRKINKAY